MTALVAASERSFPARSMRSGCFTHSERVARCPLTSRAVA
jgi:hypothetical protein